MKRILVLLIAGTVAGVLWRSRQSVPHAASSPVRTEIASPPALSPSPSVSRPAINDLTESRMDHWQKPSPLEPMAAFQKWSADYTAQPEAAKISEGVKLAQNRRATLLSLIKHDPEQALANAVPEAVRRAMPAEVKALLEAKVDARGNLMVTAMSFEGGRVPKGKVAERTHAVLEDGRRLQAFVYGNREFQPSRENVPIHGIAVDGLMAVSQWPSRVLEPVERMDAKKTLAAEPVCPTSGITTSETGTEVAILTGTQVDFYCGPAHARQVLTEAAAAEATRPPGLGVRTKPVFNAASDAPGQSVPNFLSEGDANWTTGSQRLGIVRITHGGFNYHDLSVQDCEDIIDGMSVAYDDWSYGRCNIRSVSSTGSFITPILNIDAYQYYLDEDNVDSIWAMAHLWAMANGRMPGTYDWIMVIAGDDHMKDDEGDSVGWTGLAQVGGGNSYMRTTTVDGTISVGLHELGHNLGLRHSSNLWPAPVLKGYENGIPVYQFGAEYGDRYDKMGRGKEDFNVRYKDWLQWLDDANLPLAATDGHYTLREHDMEEKSGIRGLQVPFNVAGSALGEDSLFVEYRLNNPEDPLLACGAEIHLSSPSKPKTYLLDCTPETPNDEPDDENGDPDLSGNLDAVLLPGRTFRITKYSTTVFITNISADPDSGEMEVEINHGTPAGNDAPAGSITTNTPTGAVGQKIYFTCSATDADGDELAYHWQVPGFGPFENKNTMQVTFPATGTKVVKCLVSDKHGGVTTLIKNFSVANNSPPSISSISDRSTDEDVPLTNVPFTVSDPTTPAGSLTVSAVSDNTYLFPAGSIALGGSGGNRTISLTPGQNRHGVAIITVTVSDGGLQDTEEFKVTVHGVTPGTTLIAANSTWRYWDATPAPSANWNVPSFNDTAWLSDTARFVYPAQPLGSGWTVLSTPATPRATCYFRRSFLMPSSPVGTPTLRFLCDDGLIIYSAGQEIWRHNMPDGTVGHNTKASSSVVGGKALQWITVPLNIPQFHTGGLNTIAVEVHDAGGSRGSGDVAFDMQLRLVQAPAVSDIADKSSPEDTLAGFYGFTATESESPPAAMNYSAVSSNQALVLDSNVKVGLNIFTGARYIMATPQPNATGVTEITLKVNDGDSETWEKFNLTVTPVNDAPWLMPLPDMAVAMNELAPLVEVQVGDVDNDPASLIVTATSSNAIVLPNAGIQVLPGTAPNRRWLRLSPNSGIGAQATVTVTVSDGALTANDAFVFRVSTPFGPATTDVKLVQSGETWRYWPAALPLVHGQPVDFTDPGLDDRAWPSGPSQLGYGNDGEVTDVPVTPYRVTTYFRKKFTVPTPGALTHLKMRMLRDDGAIVYLNGTQVWSSNMPREYIAATPAESDISGAAEDTWQTRTITTAALVSGSNTIAVELHQSAMPSSLAPGDLTFDFEIDGVPADPSSTDVLVAPGEMWAYWDQSSYPDATWKLATYAEDGWKYGLARLGYGIGGESTVVNKDNDAGTQRNPAVLFRKVFDIADPSACAALHLYLQRDDGIAVHLNGTRVHTEHLPATFSLADLATAEAAAGEQTQWRHYLIDPRRLIAGRNLLAVEIHQFSLTGADLNFDLQLIGELSGTPTLYLNPSGPNMELAWPAAYGTWSLRASTDLSSWTPVAEPPLLDSGWIYVLTPSAPNRQFFKLIKP